MAVGIDNLKKAAKAAIDVGIQIDVASKDGFTWVDLFGFVDEITEVTGVIKTWSDLKAELQDLDTTERLDLNAYIQTEFDIPNDKVEAVIEDALALGFSIIGLVQKIRVLKVEKGLTSAKDLKK